MELETLVQRALKTAREHEEQPAVRRLRVAEERAGTPGTAVERL